MNSPFSYFGGKARMVPHIVSLFPNRMDAYIEAYFGSGAVFFAAETRWAQTEIINDLNRDVTNFFEVLRDDPNELIRVLELTPHARAEYARAREKLASKKTGRIERARSFFVNVEQSFGRMQKMSGWALPSKKAKNGDRAKRWADKTRPEILHRIARRLREASIESMPALDLLDFYDAPGTLFYLDPPYIVEDKKRMLDINKSYMGFGQNEDHHKLLAERLLKIKAMAIVSGYDHQVYNPLVQAGWQKIDIETTTQVFANQKTKNTSRRVETLWISPSLQAANRQKMLF